MYYRLTVEWQYFILTGSIKKGAHSMHNIAILQRNGFICEAAAAIAQKINSRETDLAWAIAVALSDTKFEILTGDEIAKAVSLLIPELDSREKVKKAVEKFVFKNKWSGESGLRKLLA